MKTLVKFAAIVGIAAMHVSVTATPAAAFGNCNKEAMKRASGISLQSLNLDPSTMEIVSSSCGVFNAKWTFKLPSGDIFNCTADDNIRQAYCFKPKTETADAKTVPAAAAAQVTKQQ